MLAELADAIEKATGDSASIRVSLSAVDADRIRHVLTDLIDSATNPSQGWPRDEILRAHRASYGLRMVSRAWDRDTGYDCSKRRIDTDMSEDLGGGYRR